MQGHLSAERPRVKTSVACPQTHPCMKNHDACFHIDSEALLHRGLQPETVQSCDLDPPIITGLLVVSSTETVPIEQFLKLSQEQHRIQHSGEYTNPKWFIPNTLKYYVLLHDMNEGDEQRYWKKRRITLKQFIKQKRF